MADIKRMNYFDQQFLVVGDFIAEQTYHREMRLLHNRSLHTYGVAKGLDVTLSGAREVMISAGVAIDNQGREIALSGNTPHTLTNDPAGGPLLITISYGDEETDPYSSLPGKNTRIRETFSITDIPEQSADPDTRAVTLARVSLDGHGNIAIDASARRWAGPLSDETSEVAITLGRLRLGGKSIPNSQWPSLTASGANQLTVGGGLFAQSLGAVGDITLNGSLRAGGDLSGRNLSVTGDLSGRNLSVTGALSAPNATINGALSVGGSLVIGSGNPQAKLQVAAGAIVPSVGNSPQAGIQFPPNPGGGSGDEAFIRYFVTAGETAKLQIGVGNDADDSIGLVQAGAERLTVVNGNVGIGTSAPDRKLTIDQPGPSTQVFANLKNDNHEILFGVDQTAIVSAMTASDLQFRTNNANRMVITANGNVGVGTMTPTCALDVRSADAIKLGLEGRGGGRLILASNLNDNKIYLEAFSADGNGSAAELLLTGKNVDPVPQITLIAVNTRVSGALRVNGKLTVDGGKVGYVVDQFINKLGETLEEGDVVVIGESQSTLYYGQHENIPIPEVDLAQSAYHTGVCGIVCETHGELRSQTEGADDGKAKGGKKTRKPTLTPHEFTSEEMEKQERTQVQPEQIGLMVTLGAFAHCKVDADIASIKVGDLLTTSPTKGHAQKALDPAKAVGAIIGKALGSLKKGKGKIPVLVMLQ